MDRLLSNVGYETQTALSGEESIAIVSKTVPNSLDVIFMDIFMPGKMK